METFWCLRFLDKNVSEDVNWIQAPSNGLNYTKNNFSFFFLDGCALEEDKFVIGFETNKSLYGTYFH